MSINNNEQKYTCRECGAELHRHAAVHVGDETYCLDCAERLFRQCSHCGAYAPADGGRDVIRREGLVRWWCDNCISEDAITCDDCGELWSESRVYHVRGGRRVCEACIDEYRFCESCGEYVTPDDYDDDGGTCKRCRVLHLIKPYHHADKTAVFFGEAPFGSAWAGIGLEIEIDRRDSDRGAESALVQTLDSLLGKRAVYERDGSLSNGFEIITRPHTVQEFYEKFPLEAMLTACRDHGYLAHNMGTCGLHVHISRAFFGQKPATQDRAVGKLLAFVDIFRDDVRRASRRDPYAFDRWASAVETYGPRDARKKAKPGYLSRYHAINTTNRATIEFRFMRGTLNPETFRACLDFCLTIAKNAKKIRWDDVNDAGLWLEGIAPTTRDYLASRGAFPSVIPSAIASGEGGDL